MKRPLQPRQGEVPHGKKQRIVGRTHTLLAMLADADGPVPEEILREEQQRLFGQMVGARVLLLPIFAAIVIGLAWFAPAGLNTGVLVALALVIPAFFVFELVHYRRRGFTPSAVPRNLVLATLGQLGVCAASGGLSSPFIYAALPIAGLSGAFLRLRLHLACTLLQLFSVWGFAFVSQQDLLPNGLASIPWPGVMLPAWHEYGHAITLSVFLLLSGQVGRSLNRVFRGALKRAITARHELLTAHAERVRELTTLSAEIAHELKNPLFSVKGLARLLEQNITDPKGSERLSVLRREVERMQTVLEEFLNFSRPLVPLAIVSSDVAGIAAEVVALHEGLARERGVDLCCEGQLVSAHCDPRKVKQILMNLVQNALEASPEGSQITVATEARAAEVVVQVLDDGSGLDSTLGNPFEPGITSKTGGAGVGLTIARGLARQHGGELGIRSRQGGGTLAELSLPLQPHPDTSASEAP